MLNVYRVPKRQWRRWPDLCQRVFINTYAGMKMNQSLYTHPKAKSMTVRDWKTISWNAAWVAADACLASLNDISKD